MHLLNVVLETEHFLKVNRATILLYGSLAETLEQECSRGECINWSAVMKLRYSGSSEEMKLSLGVRSKSHDTIKYLACHCCPHICFAIMWGGKVRSVSYYSSFLNEES